MSSDAQQLQALFAAALEVAPAERDGFLTQACGGNQTLQQQVQRLLNVDRRLLGMTARPLAAGFGDLVAQLAPLASMEGTQIGPYRLCEALGQGGMGSVYRAERVDGVVTQQVAIKFVRRELVDANTLRRFQQERQMLASLDHPNIARLVDAAALTDGTPYFVMDYVAGLPITEYCEQAQLGLRARLQLFRNVCAAVSHAHRNLVVHRDLKPNNILVTADGTPKLLDFGIAKSLDDANAALPIEQTGTAQRFFSPRYAAPEQLLGEAISVGCDVYALGLLLYELLAGMPPFDLEGLSAGQMERLITLVPPPAPSTRAPQALNRGVPLRLLRGDLDGIIQRCLRKLPTERYGSVEQLEDDLLRYLEGRPVVARNGQALYRLRKFVGRNRFSLSVVAVASLALVVAMATLLRQNDALKRERDLSQQSLGILKDAFASADPIRASGPEISARQILDAARERIDAVFEGQPELFVALAESIAEVDLSVGRSNEAALLMMRAEAAIERAGGSPQIRQRLLILHGRALINLNHLAQAEQMLDLAGTLSAAAPIGLKIAKGRVLALQTKGTDAIKLLKECVEELSAQAPIEELANSARLMLAEAYRLSGDNANALATLDETLRWQRAGLPESHPQITRTRLRRVVPLRATGRVEESLSEALSIVDEVNRVYGADSAEAATAYTALGRSFSTLGRNAQAMDAFRTALAVWQRTFGRDHRNTLRSMFNLAYSLQLSPDNTREAEALYSELLDLAEKREGPQSEIVVYYRLYYGKFLHQQGRVQEAFSLLATPDGWVGLEASSAENRGNYMQTLRVLYDVLPCDSGREGDLVATPPKASGALCARARAWLDRTTPHS